MIRILIIANIITSSLFNFCFLTENKQINGIVRDSLTTIPLSNVNIVINDSETGQYILGTITNLKGSFELNMDKCDKVVLSVSSLGYRSKKLRFLYTDDLKPLNIFLLPDTVSLQEVTVSWKPLIDYSEEGDIALNIDQMGDVGKLSLADLMAGIPGLSIDIDGNILYGGYNSFTTLINGQRIGSYYGGKPGFILTGIAAKNIKRVEIITEPNGRFGYYTPLINIIPYGDLRDIYYASAGLGSKDKYNINLDFSKKYKKLTFRPSFDYQYKQLSGDLDEERYYNNTIDKKKIISRNIQRQLKPSLYVCYSTSRDQSLSFKIGYSKNQEKQSRRFNYIDAQTTQDKFNNHFKIVNATSAYYRRINTGIHSYLLFNANTSLNISNSNKSQQQSGTTSSGYRTNRHVKNHMASLALSQNIIHNRQVWNFSGSLNTNYNHIESGREQYNYSNDIWNQLDVFKYTTKTNRTEGKVNIGYSRLIRAKNKLNHYFKLETNGILRRESSRLSGENQELYFYYHMQQRFKYNLSFKDNKELKFRINNRITPPTHQQLHQTLTYIDDFTLEKGNSNLKHANSFDAFLSFGKNTGYVIINQGGMSKGNDIEKFGYGIEINANVNLNDIVPNINRSNDGIITHSWKNADESLTTSLISNVSWNVTKGTSLRGTFTYQYSNFDTPQYSENKSWNTNLRFRTHLPGALIFDSKVSYYSKHVNYAITTDPYFDLQFKIQRLLYKKRLRLTLSGTNLISNNGIKQEYNDSYIRVTTKKYPESPIIWLKANFLLFSYYKKI